MALPQKSADFFIPALTLVLGTAAGFFSAQLAVNDKISKSNERIVVLEEYRHLVSEPAIKLQDDLISQTDDFSRRLELIERNEESSRLIRKQLNMLEEEIQLRTLNALSELVEAQNIAN